MSKAGFLLSIFDELIFLCSSSKDLRDSRTSTFLGIIGPNAFNIPYRKMGNDALGECTCRKLRCSILFFVQYSVILPPDEKAITLQFFLCAESKIARVSLVLPETLVVATKVLESAVFGRTNPFTTLTWTLVFDNTEEKMSPIAPETHIPANTIWSIP